MCIFIEDKSLLPNELRQELINKVNKGILEESKIEKKELHTMKIFTVDKIIDIITDVFDDYTH